MKIICIDNYASSITVGKVYDVTMYYYIADDNGDLHWYHREAFMTLDEWKAEHRDKQISEIL